MGEPVASARASAWCANAVRRSARGGVDEALREDREQSGVVGGVGRVGRRDSRFDHGEIAGGAAVEPHEAAIRCEHSPDQRLPVPGSAGQLRSLLEGGQRLGVAGHLLGVAEAHEEIGALGVGSIKLLCDVQRNAEVAGRLNRGEVREGVLAGPDGPIEGLRGQPGQGTVPGQLDHDVGWRRLVSRDQAPRRVLVQVGAARRADLGVQRLGDECVDEPRRSPDRAQVDEEPCHDRRIQRGAHGGPGEVQHLEQDILVDLYAEHRRCGEHLRYLIPERVHPAPHDLSQVGRDVVGTVPTRPSNLSRPNAR